MYIGIDDTDSRESMCTTYLVKIIVEEIQNQGVNLIGPPRLVRLNPNIPWKTRGNGAIALKIGRGYGSKTIVGEIKEKKIYAFKYGRETNIDIDKIVAKVKDHFVISNNNTNPGIVFSPTKLPESLYWKAVRGIVSISLVENILKKYRAFFIKFKKGRGIIGASAAIAWKRRRFTYELLTYLPENQWNKERYIDKESVLYIDKKFPSTFDNYDYENDYIAIVPRSKTPVLYGIRGTDLNDLLVAKNFIKSSYYDTWFLFLTNQGSDDHIVKKKIAEIRKYENIAVKGYVDSNPFKIEGGHVIFKLRDLSGVIDCTAYEPTKNFRNIIEQLRIGDYIEVYGSVRSAPRTINIEKMKVIKLTKIKIKVSNPLCPKCGRSMESIGHNKGYRCRKCGIKLPENTATYKTLKRSIKEGWYEVPVIARRHLAKPLKLVEKKSSKIF